MFRYANPESLKKVTKGKKPCYAEFYPGSGPAMQFFPDGRLLAFLPDGTTVEKTIVANNPSSSIARVMFFTTAVGFDEEKFRPHASFLDEFPDGTYRIHRDLVPDEKESILRWNYPPWSTKAPRATSKKSAAATNTAAHENSASDSI